MLIPIHCQTTLVSSILCCFISPLDISGTRSQKELVLKFVQSAGRAIFEALYVLE